MTRLTAKTSTIFIASGDSTRVYHSVGDVPPELRRKLEQSTKGSHSATILIADRRGREELVRALRGRAKHVASPSITPPAYVSFKDRLNLRNLLGVGVPLLIGLFIWFFIASSF